MTLCGFQGFASNIGQYSRVQTSMYDESVKSIDSQSVDESLLMVSYLFHFCLCVCLLLNSDYFERKTTEVSHT